MIAITPVMFTLHRRWGLAVPAVMAVAATGVDTAVVGYRVPFIGLANFCSSGARSINGGSRGGPAP